MFIGDVNARGDCGWAHATGHGESDTELPVGGDCPSPSHREFGITLSGNCSKLPAHFEAYKSRKLKSWKNYTLNNWEVLHEELHLSPCYVVLTG